MPIFNSIQDYYVKSQYHRKQMANINSNRYTSDKKKNFFKGKTFMLLLGVLFGAGIMVAFYTTSVYFTSDESCMQCHVHPHAEQSWKLSKHVNNGSGLLRDDYPSV